MTYWEEQQVGACVRVRIQALVVPTILDTLEDIKREAKRGPLDRYQIKTLKLFARHNYPGARELLQKCSQGSAKNQKTNLPVTFPIAPLSPLDASSGGWQLR